MIIKSSNVPAPVTDPLCVGPSSYIYSFILLLLLNLYRDLVGWEVGVGGRGGGSLGEESGVSGEKPRTWAEHLNSITNNYESELEIKLWNFSL